MDHRRRLQRLFVRNVDGGALLERFLVSAVAAMLSIRLYLRLTGYPRVGGGGLHIAHMLWGGLLMLIAIVLTLAYLGHRVQLVAAIFGGIGFGTFIDELGKFITSDNDYFFEPTIALIYIIFILLFLVFRALERHRTLSEEEYLINALAILEEAILHDLNPEEQAEAALLLDKCASQTALAAALRDVLRRSEIVPTVPSLTVRLYQRARALYFWIVGLSWFPLAITGFFLLHAAAALVVLAESMFAETERSAHPFITWGHLLSSVLANALVLVGVLYLRRSRLTAFLWFKRSILVSIFLVHFFAFYVQELAALAGFIGDLLILSAMNYLITEERRTVHEAHQMALRPIASPV